MYKRPKLTQQFSLGLVMKNIYCC